jgi:hypothetical protein
VQFGGFATPERQLIFSIDDLDETLPRSLGGHQSVSPPNCRTRMDTDWDAARLAAVAAYAAWVVERDAVGARRR